VGLSPGQSQGLGGACTPTGRATRCSGQPGTQLGVAAAAGLGKARPGQPAQALIPTCWAIAWDWVLTPAGLRLLQGTVGWGTAMPPRLNGGE